MRTSKSLGTCRELGEESAKFIRHELETTWGSSHLAVLDEQEAQKWLLGVGLYSTPFVNLTPDFHTIQNHHTPLSLRSLSLLQALQLLRLATELEGKVVALKREALQHITIALAGTDTCGLFQLLTMFFGTGEDEEDPFNFLDGAPLIK